MDMETNSKSWRHLFHSPYRFFFWAGTVSAVLAMLIWFNWIHLLDRGMVLFSWEVAPTPLHAHLMIYDVCGFFFFGFLLTAFPRFLGVEAPKRITTIVIFAFLTLATVAWHIGGLVETTALLVGGTSEFIAYALLLITLTQAYFKANFKQSDPSDPLAKQPLYLLISVFFGLIGSMALTWWQLGDFDSQIYRLALDIGTYGFLLLTIVTVSFRITPFFMSKMISDYQPTRSRSLLPMFTLFIVLRIVANAPNMDPSYSNLLKGISELACLLLLIKEWRSWWHPTVKRNPMLWTFFISFGWIAFFLLLSSLSNFLPLFGYEFLGRILSIPALHAFYIGGMGTLILGMASRVILGHGGMPIKGEKVLIWGLLFIQLSALWRVGFGLAGAFAPNLSAQIYLAGFFWCLAFGIWGWRFLPKLTIAPPNNAN